MSLHTSVRISAVMSLRAIPECWRVEGPTLTRRVECPPITPRVLECSLWRYKFYFLALHFQITFRFLLCWAFFLSTHKISFISYQLFMKLMWWDVSLLIFLKFQTGNLRLRVHQIQSPHALFKMQKIFFPFRSVCFHLSRSLCYANVYTFHS